LITIICLLLCSLVGFTQAEVDSLKHRLKTHTEKDSGRVNLLNQLGYRHWTIDPLKSIVYGNEALQMADSSNYLPGLAFAGRVIGVAHWAQGNHEEGLEYLMKSLATYQTLQDTLNIANIQMNIGLIYSEQKRFEEALSNYQVALHTFRLLRQPKRQVNTAIHIGELYQQHQQLEKALSFYKMALTLSDSAQYLYGLSSANRNLGSLYKEQGKLDSALIYCQWALPIQDKMQDRHGKAFSLFIMGTVYMARRDFEHAEEKLLQSLESALRVSYRKLRSDIYLNLKAVAEEKGNYQAALAYYEQYVVVKDSLWNAVKLRDFVRLENKFALERKEQKVKMQQEEMKILQQDAKLQKFAKNGLLAGLLVVIILGYLMVSRQRLRIRKNKELLRKNQQIYLSEQALAQSELENARLKEKELISELEFRNKELTSYTINFMQKNELLEELKANIEQIDNTQDNKIPKQLKAVSRLVDNNMHQDKDWEDFKRRFEEVHQGFFRILKVNCPKLTSNELKLCSLLKLNMNLKEAASIMGISPESVKTARYRLRKKLNLSRKDNLIDYIIRLEESIPKL
jgi:tetratricopeptide (TPR) repeat protein